MIRASVLLVLASLSLTPSAAFAAPLCDFSNPHNAAQFQQVNIFITKSRTIVWNGTPVTREQFRAYMEDEVANSWSRGPIVYNFIPEESLAPAVMAKARSVVTEAQALGAAFPGCPLASGYLRRALNALSPSEERKVAARASARRWAP
jgi:hypothetical protein